MLRTIYDFIASDYYEPVNRLVLAWGLISIAMLVLGRARTGWTRIVAWAGIVALAASLLVSMIFEDFLPGLETGRTGAANAIGLAGILLGLLMFVYGGYRFVRDTFGRIDSAAKLRFGRRRKGARTQGLYEIEPVPVRGWVGIWGPSLLWMAGGFALIVIGASLNNQNRFPLAWFWGWFGL